MLPEHMHMFTLLYFTLHYFTLLCFISLYITLRYFALLCFTLLYFTLFYFTLLYFTDCFQAEARQLCTSIALYELLSHTDSEAVLWPWSCAYVSICCCSAGMAS